MVQFAGGRELGDVDLWDRHGHDPKLIGSSLLESLPFNRTCEDSGIPLAECVCGGEHWEELVTAM